jgi:Flp pilus assembly protein protease CpaA
VYFTSAYPLLILVKIAITAWLGLVAVWDSRTGFIPNWLTLPVVAVGGAFSLYVGPMETRVIMLLCWAVLLIVWRLYIFRGGDAKFLMGLFALFPRLDFILIFCIVLFLVTLGLVIADLWRQRPEELRGKLAARLGARQFLPTSEELERRGRHYAWTFSLAGAVALWLLW